MQLYNSRQMQSYILEQSPTQVQCLTFPLQCPELCFRPFLTWKFMYQDSHRSPHDTVMEKWTPNEQK